MKSHSHLPPPKRGSVCRLWVGAGHIKARVRRTESFLSWLLALFPRVHINMLTLLCIQPMLVLFLLSFLAKANTHLYFSLQRNCPRTCMWRCTLYWFKTNTALLCPYFLAPLQFLFQKMQMRVSCLVIKAGGHNLRFLSRMVPLVCSSEELEHQIHWQHLSGDTPAGVTPQKGKYLGSFDCCFGGMQVNKREFPLGKLFLPFAVLWYFALFRC